MNDDKAIRFVGINKCLTIWYSELVMALKQEYVDLGTRILFRLRRMDEPFEVFLGKGASGTLCSMFSDVQSELDVIWRETSPGNWRREVK